MRQHRRDANDLFKSAEKDGDLPEDVARRGLTKVQEMTDGYVAKVDSIVTAKETEIMED